MSGRNNIESEYLELTKNEEWGLHYQKIRAISSKNMNTLTESVKPQNKKLNRYQDVAPYDHSRIILKKGTTDYINANLVKVEKANRRYILTQGPLCTTVSHFWLMAWEQQSKAVLMLNKLIEKKQEKCTQYWPAKIGEEHIMKMENVRLTLEYLEFQDHSYYMVRKLRLTDMDSGDSRDILQFHYTTWPDFGVPGSPTAFVEFLRKVRDAGVLDSSVGPAIVHCSAGIGRSGTFCLVDSCLVLIEKEGINSVNVTEILLEMRQYRMGLIQTPEQLRFSYQAIIEGAKQLNGMSLDKENCNSENIVLINNIVENNSHNSSDEDEPPPLPPPRLESLNRNEEGPPIDKPLPKIPNSISCNDFPYIIDDKEYVSPPSGPLPVLPAEECSSEDELEDEDDIERTDSSVSEKSDSTVPTSPLSPSAEVRQRKRMERNEMLAAQVHDMKRRQQANEQWTQLKRSLLKPVVITSVLAISGGILAYLYYKA